MMARNATVAVKFTGDVADLKRATGEAERELESFGSRAGPKLKTAMAGAGLAAGAVLVDSFLTAMDQENTTARLGASLGLSDADAKRLGKTAGDIYTAGWGESFDAVSGAVETVVSTLGDELDPDDIEAMTTKAIALADVFQLDVSEAVRAAGFMIRNNLAPDATTAFDQITVALQKLPTEMRGEALEAISEYGANFAALGIDGSEAFNLIVSAAQDTSVGVDKVGDSIKEFLIRSTDGSAATREALGWLKIDADEVARAIASGGPAAEEAFGKIVDALLAVEDPAYRAQLAVALFGTPIEDLSIDKIPAFLTALQNVDQGLGDVEGAADDVTEAMNTNQASVEAWKRKVQQDLVDFLAETAIPAVQDFEENFGLSMQLIGFYINEAALTVVSQLGNMADAFGGPIKGAKDLLGFLADIAGDGALNAAADVLGVPKSDLVLLPPEEFARRNGGGTSPAVRPGTRSDGSSWMPRAMGGPVAAGAGYMTGERGPELFVPEVDGQIVPSSRIGGSYNVTINNHYPRPESASDVLPRMMRQMQYFVGGAR